MALANHCKRANHYGEASSHGGHYAREKRLKQITAVSKFLAQDNDFPAF